MPHPDESSVVVQTLFAQHPVGHDAESQTHEPFTHASPGPQGEFRPQVHWPPVEQPSALIPHGLHAPPPAPHWVTEGVTHVAPAQQPLHDFELQLPHVPPLHVSVGHGAHPAPCDPQDAFVLPGSHTPPSSQHPVHEVWSQTQLPFTQRCPVVHAAPPPHVQTPVGVQPSATGPHGLHDDPFEPHSCAVAGETQLAPSQQPP